MYGFNKLFFNVIKEKQRFQIKTVNLVSNVFIKLLVEDLFHCSEHNCVRRYICIFTEIA